MPARVRPHTHGPWNPEDYRARDLQWSLVGLRDGAQLRFKTWLMASDAISSQVGGKASDLGCARWKRVSQDDSHGLSQFAVS
jgi:hypothetical protein